MYGIKNKFRIEKIQNWFRVHTHDNNIIKIHCCRRGVRLRRKLAVTQYKYISL